jgi:hypothetical protein
MWDGLADVWRQHMRRGNFEAAWRISDISLCKRIRERISQEGKKTLWCGEPLERKRVLIRCSYGLGDTLQFIRFVPLVQRITRKVSLGLQQALMPLVKHIDGLENVVVSDKNVSSSGYDAVLGITELPHVFRTNVATIPASPYVKVTPRGFRPTSSLRVGLVWQGSDWDERRTVPVQLFAEFERIPGVILHIIQRGPALDTWRCSFGINSGSDDIYEAARTIAALDLMITIDSMPAHLAAAMGVPTWVLLHSDCDWRWMENRSDSPWYPSMRLFRQESAGDWQPVINKIKGLLASMATRDYKNQVRRRPRFGT